MFQDAKLLAGRTVFENVAFVLRVLGTPRREITPTSFAALKAVGLSARAQAHPHQLSQGEAQRASLARAIVKAPPLLIADEPTGNLDDEMAEEILELHQGHLDRWVRPCFFATHQAKLVGRLKRRTLRLRGRRAREGRGLSVPSFLVNEALRDLRRAGRVGVSAILLIALSLAALGGFWLLSLNLGRAIGQWRDRVRVIVYLREEPPPGKVDELLSRIEARGGIQRVRYVSKNEALQTLKRSLGGQADVADQLPRNPLPASVEVTPDPDRATPEGTRELVRRLAALPEVEDVQGGAHGSRDWPSSSGSFSSWGWVSAPCSRWRPS